MGQGERRRAVALALILIAFVGVRFGLPLWSGLVCVLAGAILYLATVRLMP